jgi:TRAP-type uncharacterized transport system substrate-binding protein
VGRKGAANTPDHKAILEKYGILGNVKFVYTGYGGGANKMKDGLVDATFMIFNLIYPDKFSKGGFIEKMETSLNRKIILYKLIKQLNYRQKRTTCPEI